MKFIYVWIFALAISPLAQADEKSKNNESDYALTGEAQLVSHLIVKGLSYSDSNPAMNASFLAKLGEQAKIGVWGSNISNLSAVDDNFWFKLVATFHIDFTDKFFADIFVYDNHFYKSNQRNGQNLGMDFNYKSYEFGIEWMSNYEGTKTNAEYFKFGKLFDYKKDFRFGGYAGVTNSHTSALNSYLDVRAIGQYLFNSYSNAEIGATYNSNQSQFGKRGDAAFYIGIKLAY